jgi:hypothetical protein
MGSVSQNAGETLVVQGGGCDGVVAGREAELHHQGGAQFDDQSETFPGHEYVADAATERWSPVALFVLAALVMKKNLITGVRPDCCRDLDEVGLGW